MVFVTLLLLTCGKGAHLTATPKEDALERAPLVSKAVLNILVMRQEA